MSRRRQPKTPSRPKPPDTSGQGPSAFSLKGGVGDEPAGKQLFEGSLARYAVDMPASLATLQTRMRTADEGIAEAVIAAAYQHSRLPDDGTRLYARAFQTLDLEQQKKLLSKMPPEDAGLVNTAFQDAVEQGDPSPAPATPARKEDRVKEVARKAIADLDKTETLDLDPYAAPDVATKPRIPLERGEQIVQVEAPGPDWTSGQIKRGYRRILYGPTEKGAPRGVVELVKDRAGDYDLGDQPQTPQPENPNYLQTKTIYRPKADADTMTVSRVTPFALEELSPEAQRAAATGAELLEMLGSYEEAIPGFSNTPEGQRIAARVIALADQFPEAEEFMNNPGLETYTIPKDPGVEKQGRDALPRQMRLGYFIGTPASSAPHKWETRGDRRSTVRLGGGKTLEIPADAPNRQGWIEAMTYTREVTETGPDGNKRTVTKRFLRPEAVGPGRMGTVNLPFSAEISRPDTDYRADKFYQQDTELRGAPAKRLGSDVAESAPLTDDALVTDADLELALDPTTGKEVSRFSDDPNAKPVEDNTLDAGVWETPPDPRNFVLQAGTAEGSPAKVKRDRDFALREGKSATEKLAEKLWRASQEFSDPEFVTDTRRLGEVADGGIDYAQAEGVGFAQEAMLEATGGGGEVRKRSSGSAAPRSRDVELLDMDGLAPIWRAQVEDVDEYGRPTFRRPTSYEIAGFLVDRADIPDPGMATRIEPLVRASMAAMEGTPAKGKAKRIAGKPYEASAERQRDLYGGPRPEWSDEAKQTLANWESQQAQTDAAGFVTEQEFSAAETAGAAPVEAGTPNPFSAMVAKARKAASNPTNIGALLTMLGAAGSAQGEELPEVEYLAMSRRRPTTQSLRSAKPPATPAPPEPAKSKPQAKPKPQPQPQPAPQPAATQSPAPAPTAPVTPAAATPRRPMFPKDPVARVLGGVANHVGNYFPSYTLGAAALGAGTMAAPYVGPPIKKGAQYMVGMGGGDEAPDPQADSDAMKRLFEQLRQEGEAMRLQESPQPPPSLDRSTTNIQSLLRMLSPNA